MIIRKKVVDKKISEYEEQQLMQYRDGVHSADAAQNYEQYNNNELADEDYDYPDTEDEDFVYDEENSQENVIAQSDENEQQLYEETPEEYNSGEEAEPQENTLNQENLEAEENPDMQEQNLDANLTPEEYSEPQTFEHNNDEELIQQQQPEEIPQDLNDALPQEEIAEPQQPEIRQPHKRRIKEKEQVRKQPASLADEEINLFDLDNIDFSQRQERRRGDRRRGFRRVDDRNLVSRAREEADSIRQSAMNEGYQAGLEAAHADIDMFKSSVSEFMKAKQEVFEYIAPDILEISVDIAQKIIKKEVEQNPQVLFNTIVDVLKTLSKEESKVTLRVNPIELNTVKEAVPRLITLAGIDTKVVVLSDENVTEGGCLVTTTNGVVDATVESRIRVVMQALREM